MKRNIISPDEEISTIQILWRIYSVLKLKDKRILILVILVMLLSGLAEAISIASVLPFLSILENPNKVWEITIVQKICSYFNITSSEMLIFPSAIVFIFVILLSSIIRIFNLYLNGRVTAKIGSDLSCRAFKNSLYQDYSSHIIQNSSSVINTTTNQINLTILAINSALQFLTALVVTLCLLAIICSINFKIAFIAGISLSVAYFSIGIYNKKSLNLNSKYVTKLSNVVMRVLQEGLGSFRNVILDNTQNFYSELYGNSDYPMRRYQANSRFVRGFPRYVFEPLGIILIVIMAIYLRAEGRDNDLIPLLGTIALCAQRLLPSLQQAFSSWGGIRSNSSSVISVLNMINRPSELKNSKIINSLRPYNLKNSISLKNVSFKYPNSKSVTLKNINLTIMKGERIGIVGPTGSGKSTLLDLLLGLFTPESGEFKVDNISLYSESNKDFLYRWQKGIGHVPQSIYLADSSFAENIAFGVPQNKIDLRRVKSAAEQSRIKGFIEYQKGKYNSFVGERGIRLSGGQRQRICIARALYKKCSVLFFDEATSALDNETERAVMNSIEKLNKQYTIIMVAHRLSTLKNCDRIYHLDSGEIKKISTPKIFLKDE